MKMRLVLLLFIIGYVHCKKTYQPIDKNANSAFINMEGGGAPKTKPAPVPNNPAPTNQQSGGSLHSQQPQTPTKPVQPSQPSKPTPPQTPVQTKPEPVKPNPTPVQPVPQNPSPSKPVQPGPSKPVQPSPAGGNTPTPGPGSVKQLINFYDSQGKASPIRPYSYSQAVKQGKQ